MRLALIMMILSACSKTPAARAIETMHNEQAYYAATVQFLSTECKNGNKKACTEINRG